MQDLDAVDPFTQVYRAVLGGFKADGPLKAQLGRNGRDAVLGGPGGQMPDWTDPDFVSPKEALQPSDWPYLMLGLRSLRFDYARTANAVGFDLTLRLATHAANWRLMPLNFVSWRSMVVLAKLQPVLGLPGLVQGFNTGSEQVGPDAGLGGLHLATVLDVTVSGYVDRRVILSL